MFSVILLLKLFVKPVLSYLIEVFGPGYFHQHVDFMDNLTESDFLLFLFKNNFFDWGRANNHPLMISASFPLFHLQEGPNPVLFLVALILFNFSTYYFFFCHLIDMLHFTSITKNMLV